MPCRLSRGEAKTGEGFFSPATVSIASPDTVRWRRVYEAMADLGEWNRRYFLLPWNFGNRFLEFVSFYWFGVSIMRRMQNNLKFLANLTRSLNMEWTYPNKNCVNSDFTDSGNPPNPPFLNLWEDGQKAMKLRIYQWAPCIYIFSENSSPKTEAKDGAIGRQFQSLSVAFICAVFKECAELRF
jgi:hypothetical protein